MIAARSLALGLNRYIDREIDAKNPRTKNRALPKGLLTDTECLIFCTVSLLFCFLAAYNLPSVIWLLLPVILGLFVFYPFTKRFTWSCHFWLGLTMGLAPVGGWAAVSNDIPAGAILLGLAVFFLIAGSDLIYTIQDLEIDRVQGLYSITARFGVEFACKLSRLLHVGSFICLIAVGGTLDLGILYYIGIALASIFMGYQDSLIVPDDLSKISEAFFATNAFVSVVVLIFTIGSIWLNIDLHNLIVTTNGFL